LRRPWRVERAAAPAAELAVRGEPHPAERTVSLLTPTAPALVLGSTQGDEVVDRARAREAGLDVVRRRTGGGAVLVRPEELWWVELFVPVGDGLWRDDVARAFDWVGEVWREALHSLGVDARSHRGALPGTRWSRLVCFAGVGPGELLVDGRKVVGISQRRTRGGARFACAALRRWDADALVSLLALSDAERTDASRKLRGVARGLDVDGDLLEHALLAHLPE
jgi:lipoate-protein ligase A